MLIKLLISVFLISPIACHASNKEKSFEEFWVEFREASLKEDYSSLETFIKFPLEVKGVDDEAPAQFYPNDKLPEIFPQLLEQVIYKYEGDELKENSFRELIKNKEIITADADKKFYRFEQFEFQIINGRWLLIRAYLE